MTPGTQIWRIAHLAWLASATASVSRVSSRVRLHRALCSMAQALDRKSSVVVLLDGSTPLAEGDQDDFDWRVAEITSALDAGRCNR